MINIALGKYKLRLAKDTPIERIEISNYGQLNEMLYEKWLYSKSVLLFENKCSNEYYLTVPVYSTISLYIKDDCITDDISLLADVSDISENALKQLVAYTFICSPTTLFNTVKKLPRWSCFHIKGDNYSFEPISIAKISREAELKNVLNDCFQIEEYNSKSLLAYSGGLDSTLLYHSLKDKLKDYALYSIFVIGGRDESYYQKIGVPQHEIVTKSIMTEKDVQEALKSTTDGYELFGCSIALKYDFMFKDVKRKEYKSIITGDGPDDIFICQKTLDRFVDVEKAQLLPLNNNTECDMIDLPVFKEDISNPWYWYNFILMAESNYYFERVYAKKNNVSLITPFLNPKLLAYCAEISQKIYGMTEKQLLKEYCQGIVHDEIINRRKMGFTSDVALWFKKNGVLYTIAKNLIAQSYKLPYGNQLKKELSELLKEHAKSEYDPNASTGGKGVLNQLYVEMLVLYWLYKMENGKDIECDF